MSTIGKEKSDTVETKSECQKSDEIEVGKSDEAKEDVTPPMMYVDTALKSEIFENQNEGKGKDEEKSEITDKMEGNTSVIDQSEISDSKEEGNSTGVENKKDIGRSNKSNRKRLLLSPDFMTKATEKEEYETD